MVGADRLNVPAIDTFSHDGKDKGGGGGTPTQVTRSNHENGKCQVCKDTVEQM